jgi:factor associated with neutral sphingomyelinase activation
LSGLVDVKTETGSELPHDEKPYMYLSHYSTPGIVLYYLIRKFPSYILKI